MTQLFVAVVVLLAAVARTNAFSPKATSRNALLQSRSSCSSPSKTRLQFFNNNGKDGSQEEVEEEAQQKSGFGFFKDLEGMMSNFDDVVDDFVYKRMGAGEQWYGKRKYSPSGRVDGKYNGMGQSDQFRIELARVQKEEMEKRRQRRLAEEEEERRKRQMN
eukprot:CAMPEP_0113631934 /NCGR_PEP_ID=MMETSP0017_2-20120614/16597_1 /TAXON_ID=2856 /ORGANISM="Cylindrotheca closterium" /LENGTH=160 /DNA_ID=CAMNT_0000542467 /DNA_START=59 /DNA_END=541 /DNA_ORIENTATION=- /assembly_acc=CAM_ASM_000147